ncbi:MAG: glycosyltransferase family 4 protein [Patescibacteria group bacterium]|nr:glycosyltransferase family 4 protein [Patescibacteria group bacterium]
MQSLVPSLKATHESGAQAWTEAPDLCMVAHVRIVSNEYIHNLPGQKKSAHGGTAIFAKHFSRYVTEQGHTWIGIIHRNTKGRRTYIKKHPVSGRYGFFDFFFPTKRFSQVTRSKKALEPRKIFKAEIMRLQAFFREMKPDVVFLNGFSAPAWTILIAAHEEGIPVVIQHAGIMQVEMEIHKRVNPPVARKFYLEMERDIVRFATRQIFLNEYSKGIFCTKVAEVPQGQAEIIPLPYGQEMLEKFRQKKKKKADDAIRIGNVARWDLIKDYGAYLKIAKAAHTDDLPWEFHSVMIIPDTKFKRRLKAQYRKHIQVHHPMGRDDLAGFYAEMDMLILPSRFDVSPTVVMEAALAGKGTLISPHVGWVSEYRSCGMRDWIIDFDDPKKVVERMKRLLRRNNLKVFRTYLIKRHSPTKVFAAYLKVFKQVQTI